MCFLWFRFNILGFFCLCGVIEKIMVFILLKVLLLMLRLWVSLLILGIMFSKFFKLFIFCSWLIWFRKLLKLNLFFLIFFFSCLVFFLLNCFCVFFMKDMMLFMLRICCVICLGWKMLRVFIFLFVDINLMGLLIVYFMDKVVLSWVLLLSLVSIILL